jgi:hypothetical protein
LRYNFDDDDDDDLVGLNLLTMQSRQRFIDTLFLISAFKNKFNGSSILDAVNVLVPI